MHAAGAGVHRESQRTSGCAPHIGKKLLSGVSSKYTDPGPAWLCTTSREAMSTFDHFVAFISSMDGRDQASKAVQYSCRAVQHVLLTADKTSDVGLRARAMYKATSQARKLFKVARWLKHYQSILSAFSKLVRSPRCAANHVVENPRDVAVAFACAQRCH